MNGPERGDAVNGPKVGVVGEKTDRRLDWKFVGLMSRLVIGVNRCLRARI